MWVTQKAKLISVLFLACTCIYSEAASPADVVFVRQNSEPKFLTDNNGLCDQVYSLLSAELNAQSISVEVDVQFYPIKRILRLLGEGQANVFCGASFSEDRDAQYVYSELPVYIVSNVLSAHKDEKIIPTSFEAIIENQLVIGSFYGTNSADWLASHDGVRVSQNHHDIDQVIELIASERSLRYFFYHDLGLNYYVSTRNLPLKVLPTKYRTINQWFLYSKNTPEHIIAALDNAMAKITASGQLKAIQDDFLVK